MINLQYSAVPAPLDQTTRIPHERADWDTSPKCGFFLYNLIADLSQLTKISLMYSYWMSKGTPPVIPEDETCYVPSLTPTPKSDACDGYIATRRLTSTIGFKCLRCQLRPWHKNYGKKGIASIRLFEGQTEQVPFVEKDYAPYSPTFPQLSNTSQNTRPHSQFIHLRQHSDHNYRRHKQTR